MSSSTPTSSAKGKKRRKKSTPTQLPANPTVTEEPLLHDFLQNHPVFEKSISGGANKGGRYINSDTVDAEAETNLRQSGYKRECEPVQQQVNVHKPGTWEWADAQASMGTMGRPLAAPSPSTSTGAALENLHVYVKPEDVKMAARAMAARAITSKEAARQPVEEVRLPAYGAPNVVTRGVCEENNLVRVQTSWFATPEDLSGQVGSGSRGGSSGASSSAQGQLVYVKPSKLSMPPKLDVRKGKGITDAEAIVEMYEEFVVCDSISYSPICEWIDEPKRNRPKEKSFADNLNKKLIAYYAVKKLYDGMHPKDIADNYSKILKKGQDWKREEGGSNGKGTESWQTLAKEADDRGA